MSDFNEGKTVKGYKLNLAIGAGGFGTVYHAYQEVLNREVAVKVIKEKYVNDPQFVRQFESEAKTIARLEHFNIVALYDYWRDPSGAYLVMRWLRGGSLRSHLKQSKLTVPQIVRILNQTAAALSFAHQHNVIHRDIKPENILLDQQGNAFLTDFGIAVDLRSAGEVNVENISFGSPDYVAPEQIREKIITPRSDIYSLGIMLYEMLAHQRPFVSEDPKEIMKMQLYNPVPSLKLKRRDLPHEIDTVIWQATAKNPAHRYDSVLQLAVAFQNIAEKMENIPADYTISTEIQSRGKLSPMQNPMDMPTESLNTGSLMTENFDGDSYDDDDMATGILPEFQDDGLPDYVPQVETIPDALPTTDFDADVSDKEKVGDNPMDTPVEPELVDEPYLMTPVPGDYEEAAESYETAQLEDPLKVMTMTIEGQGFPNPYKGLRPFEEADAGTFFGREEVVKQLIHNIDENDERFLALIGPSGSGKSSLVRAGLIPAFKQGSVEGSFSWFYTTMVPSDDPFRELSEALLRVAIAAPDNWGDILRETPQGLYTLLNQILPDDGSDLLLFIDQFEEVFVVSEDEEARELFLGSLWYAANQEDSRLRVIITLRADFYDRPLHYPQFGQMLKEHTEVVLPLNLQELEAAILGPAERVGLMVDSQLTNAILNDVHNQPGALPLLQYTLTEMYERRQGHRLSYAEYLEIGGISGALAKRAQEIYFSRLDDDEQNLARRLFLRIISIDQNGIATRRRVIWTELMSGLNDNQREALETVINAFSQHRLLTIDRDPTTRSPTVEIAHEALIDVWQQLRQWIDQNRNALQTRQELRVEVDRWAANKRDKSYLASGLRLAEFENLRGNDFLALRPEEIEYIDAGVYQREADLRRTRRINAALTVFSIVTLILAIAAVVSFFNANEARDTAEVAAQVARSRELAAIALQNRDENDLAMLLSVEALGIGQTYEAVDSLLLSLQENPLLTGYLHGHTSRVRAVDFNSTGTRAVSASSDGSLIIWDMETNTMLGEPLVGHEFGINNVQISPDDSLIASGGIGQTVRLWDLESGQQFGILEGHSDAIWGIDFNHDGSRLATSSQSGEIIVWDVAAQTIDYVIENAHNGIVYALDYDSTGERFVSGGDDNLVRVWDAETGEEQLTLSGHINWVRTVEFDPTDEAIISSGRDGFLFFWDANTGEPLKQELNTQHINGVNDISFSFDGQFLATAGADGRIFIWILLERGLRLAAIETHSNSVWSVDFSPTDFRLLSADEDGDVAVSQLTSVSRPSELVFNTNQTITEMVIDSENNLIILAGERTSEPSSVIQVWDDTNSEIVYQIELSRDLVAENQSQLVVTDMNLSPDGNLLAITTASSSVAVWDMSNGELLWTRAEHGDVAKELVFTSDGNRIISADEAGRVIVWDAVSGDLIESALFAPESGVTAMEISEDGQYLAIGGRSGIMLWNLSDETLLHSNLAGHNDAIISLAFDHENTYLFSGSRDRSIIQWNIATGEQVQSYQGVEWILSLAISPDNQLLVSGERTTGAVRIWDIASGRLIGDAIDGPNGWVSDLAFVSDHLVLASNRDNAVISSITLDVNDWVDMACNIANRSLTMDEWSQFFPEEPYSPTCDGAESQE